MQLLYLSGAYEAYPPPFKGEQPTVLADINKHPTHEKTKPKKMAAEATILNRLYWFGLTAPACLKLTADAVAVTSNRTTKGEVLACADHNAR